MEFFVGTYTSASGTSGTPSQGIYRVDLTGDRLESRGLAAECDDPSFLSWHPEHPVLYAVNERPDGPGGVTGFDAAGDGLEVLVSAETGGTLPCHLSAPAGDLLAVANYGDGSVTLFALDAAGRRISRLDRRVHQGSGPSAERQAAPHAHGVIHDPRTSWLWVPDLGADRLFAYRLDARRLDPVAEVAMPPGSGPRLMAIAADGRHAFVVGELDNSVTVLERAAGGSFEVRARVDSRGADPRPAAAAYIALCSRGRIYVSNRGADTVVTFRLRDGTLPADPPVAAGGRHPRHFLLDAAAKLLLVANRDTSNLVAFRLAGDGTVAAVPFAEVDVPAPVCVVPARWPGPGAG